MSTHYDTLGVVPTAPATVIRSAYRALMRDVHPDAGGGSGSDLAQRVNEAYGVLSDPDRRAAYDRDLNLTGSPFLGSTTTTGTAPKAQESAASGSAARRREPDPEPLPNIGFAWYDREAEQHPVTRWWRRIPVIVVTLAWIAAAGVLVALATEVTQPWAAALVAFMAGAHTLLYLRRKVLWPMVLAGGCVGLFMASPARDLEPGWGWLALAIAIVFIVGPTWGLFMTIQTVENAARDVGRFWADAGRPGATAWFVAAVTAEGSARTLCLLDGVGAPDQPARDTRSLWGIIPQGAYILLNGTHDEPAVTISSRDMRMGTKYIAVRSRMRRRR